GGRLQISLPPLPGVRPGDTVTLHVIKSLAPGKWAVAIAGRVYPATTSLALEPGAVLRARVSFSMGRLVLQVSDSMPDAIRVALERQGVPAGGPEETMARALARAGLPITPETIERARGLLTRSEAEPRRAARAIATMIDKGIDPSHPAAAQILPVLGFGERGGENPRRYREKPMPRDPKAVKELAAGLQTEAPDKPTLLQAYNHLPARSQSWIVIPFVFALGGRRTAGTMKILFDTARRVPLSLVISAEGMDFHVRLQGRTRGLTIYCSDEPLRRAITAALDGLRAEFDNMGLEVDDTVREGDAFDGFSPVAEGPALPSVDTVG
ncbi:MAG TPA: hypothetical protein VHE79_07820, partial [Spirochaetia bacterium]